MSLGVPMLLSQIMLCTCSEYTCDVADMPSPCHQISWEAPAEKKAECIQKGKSNQVGARGQEGGQGCSASHWLGLMVCVLCPGLPLFQCWSWSPSQSLCPHTQALTLYLDPFSFPDGVFQLHPLPTAI